MLKIKAIRPELLTLLASVLDPNREVAPRFLAATVTTTMSKVAAA